MKRNDALRRGRRFTLRAGRAAVSFIFCATFSTTSARSEEKREIGKSGGLPRLELVWVDTHNLFSCGLAPAANEVNRLLEQLGVEAVWVDGVAMDRPPEPNQIRVFLSRSNSKSWGLKNNALGTVRGNRSRYVYVFVPNLMAALKVGDREEVIRSAGRIHEFARAMGRVIVHEIGHIFNPGRPHTKRGLMCVKLSQGLLHPVDLVLDKESAAYIRLPMVAALSTGRSPVEAVIASPQP